MKLYSTKQCMKCQFLKKQLEDKSVSFEYVDIHEDSNALNKLIKLNMVSLPIVEIKEGQFLQDVKFADLAL